jgi:hypothetical protein
MVDNLHSDKEIATRPMDAVAARQLVRDIFDNFKHALANAGFVTSFPFHNKKELTDFLEHLPTQRVATALKYHYVKQAGTKWKINHLRDIEALSVAIPYTDAVVTDADVRDVATHRAHLDTEFDTPIFRSLTKLATYLGPLTPTPAQASRSVQHDARPRRGAPGRPGPSRWQAWYALGHAAARCVLPERDAVVSSREGTSDVAYWRCIGSAERVPRARRLCSSQWITTNFGGAFSGRRIIDARATPGLSLCRPQ